MTLRFPVALFVAVLLTACSGPKDGTDADTDVVDTDVADTDVADTDLATCDVGTVGDEACSDCLDCQAAGECADVAAACEANADCGALLGCLSACADEACFTSCEEDLPNGVADLDAFIGCVYTGCPSTCGQ